MCSGFQFSLSKLVMGLCEVIEVCGETISTIGLRSNDHYIQFFKNMFLKISQNISCWIRLDNLDQ